MKAENVLIDSDGYPILCDFGFAKYCPDKLYTACGTPNYVAPEIITSEGHNEAVDWWALGYATKSFAPK
jgi:serine/threonine protein kinase